MMKGASGQVRSGDDLDHHADCPIEHPAITQQIMSEF